MVRSRYGWLLAVSQVGFFWGLVAVLLVVLGLARRRRDRRRLRAMEEAEVLDAPARGGAAPGP